MGSPKRLSEPIGSFIKFKSVRKASSITNRRIDKAKYAKILPELHTDRN